MKFNADEVQGFKVTRVKPKQYYANTLIAIAVSVLAFLFMVFSSCVVDKGDAFITWCIIFIPFMLWAAHKDALKTQCQGDCDE